MASDVALLLQNTDEHAVSRDVRDGSGALQTIALIVEGRILEQRHMPHGLDDVETAMVGMPNSYPVTQEWTFDVSGDGRFWAVDRDRPIENDSAGWMWVPVVTAAVVHRGDPNFIAPGPR
jgi:hypothetical protein